MDEDSIFISHKQKDAALAKSFKDLLTKLCPQLDVSSMADFPEGHDWRKRLRKRLSSAKMLFLIFTDPIADWSWCLYECGFFEGGEGLTIEQDSKRLICIHPPGFKTNDLPDPLKHRQMLTAEKEPLCRFLEKFYFHTKDFGFGSSLLESERKHYNSIEEMSVQMAGLFKDIYHRQYGKHIYITLPNDQPFETKGPARIPDKASVSGDIDLFGFTNPNEPWGKIAAKVDASEWASHLAERMRDAIDGNVLEPIPSTYCCIDRAKNRCEYQPHIYRAHKSCTGDVTFSLLFAEMPRGTKTIGSFSDLILQIIELIDEARGRIKMLAFTPALGFLAQKPEEFDKLRRAIERRRKDIEFVCLTEEDLAIWHRAFEGRTSRGRKEQISASLAAEATAIAREILDEVEEKQEVRWGDLPDYYLFTNDRRAIVVNPFYLPERDEIELLKQHPDTPLSTARRKPPVEMFGAITNNEMVVSQVSDLLHHFKSKAVSADRVRGAAS